MPCPAKGEGGPAWPVQILHPHFLACPEGSSPRALGLHSQSLPGPRFTCRLRPCLRVLLSGPPSPAPASSPVSTGMLTSMEQRFCFQSLSFALTGHLAAAGAHDIFVEWKAGCWRWLGSGESPWLCPHLTPCLLLHPLPQGRPPSPSARAADLERVGDSERAHSTCSSPTPERGCLGSQALPGAASAGRAPCSLVPHLPHLTDSYLACSGTVTQLGSAEEAKGAGRGGGREQTALLTRAPRLRALSQTRKQERQVPQPWRNGHEPVSMQCPSEPLIATQAVVRGTRSPKE